jgi:hypothetical protein
MYGPRMVEIKGFPLVPWEVFSMPKDKGGLVCLMFQLKEHSCSQMSSALS